MLTFLILITAFYYALVVVLWTGWLRATTTGVSRLTGVKNPVTVVIAVRNEEQTIVPLLNDLSGQTYAPEKIIVVDDHSSDNTTNLVKDYRHHNLSVSLMELSKEQGKKKALELGIGDASTSVIALTDADCRLGPNWLAGIQAEFDTPSVKMLIGAVRVRQDGTLFSSVQAMEFASLIGTGAATLAMGFPTMCNGANLAFRKEVFDEVGGYQDNLHIPSGDDEFLMRKVYDKYPHGIKFITDPQSIVETSAQPTLKDFFYQRIRWASKWRFHRKPGSAFLAAFVFLAHTGVCALFVCMMVVPVFVKTAIILLLIRAVVEFLFLRTVMAFLGSPWRWDAFVLLQVFYSFYVVIFGVMANFRPYRWKGRKFR